VPITLFQQVPRRAISPLLEGSFSNATRGWQPRPRHVFIYTVGATLLLLAITGAAMSRLNYRSTITVTCAMGAVALGYIGLYTFDSAAVQAWYFANYLSRTLFWRARLLRSLARYGRLYQQSRWESGYGRLRLLSGAGHLFGLNRSGSIMREFMSVIIRNSNHRRMERRHPELPRRWGSGQFGRLGERRRSPLRAVELPENVPG
jgi:hypothetical protein